MHGNTASKTITPTSQLVIMQTVDPQHIKQSSVYDCKCSTRLNTYYMALLVHGC